MFERALNLLLALSYGLVYHRDAPEVQCHLRRVLETLQAWAAPGDRHEFFRITRTFLLSSAWSLIYTKIRAEHDDRFTMVPGVAESLDAHLREHFDGVVENDASRLVALRASLHNDPAACEGQ